MDPIVLILLPPSPSICSRQDKKEITLAWQLVQSNRLVSAVLISAQEVIALQSWCWHHSKHTKSWRQLHSLLQGVYLHLIRLAKRVLRKQHTEKETLFVHASHSPWHWSQSWKDWNLLIRILWKSVVLPLGWTFSHLNYQASVLGTPFIAGGCWGAPPCKGVQVWTPGILKVTKGMLWHKHSSSACSPKCGSLVSRELLALPIPSLQPLHQQQPPPQNMQNTQTVPAAAMGDQATLPVSPICRNVLEVWSKATESKYLHSAVTKRALRDFHP